MSELDPRARAFVRQAASDEADVRLSPARREEIRRRFAVRRRAGEPDIRPSAVKKAVAAMGGTLTFAVPAWAAAAVGVAAVLGGAVAVTVLRSHDMPREPVAAPIAAPPPLVRDAPQTPRRSAPPDVPAATSMPAAAPASAENRKPVAPGAASHPPASDLGGEAELLASAERALRDHDEARALTLLDEHARRYPDGMLLGEAEAARALALCGNGQRERGSEVATEIARRWPNAPLLARVLAACGAPRTDP